jgi:hypothetical protein
MSAPNPWERNAGRFDKPSSASVRPDDPAAPLWADIFAPGAVEAMRRTSEKPPVHIPTTTRGQRPTRVMVDDIAATITGKGALATMPSLRELRDAIGQTLDTLDPTWKGRKR